MYIFNAQEWQLASIRKVRDGGKPPHTLSSVRRRKLGSRSTCRVLLNILHVEAFCPFIHHFLHSLNYLPLFFFLIKKYNLGTYTAWTTILTYDVEVSHTLVPYLYVAWILQVFLVVYIPVLYTVSNWRLLLNCLDLCILCGDTAFLNTAPPPQFT